MRGTVIRIFVCLLFAGWMLYFYIDKHNELVELRLLIPQVEKDLKAVQEENMRLKYEIDRFESPIHLMEMARKPEFSHLKYPQTSEVVILPEPPPLETRDLDEDLLP